MESRAFVTLWNIGQSMGCFETEFFEDFHDIENVGSAKAGNGTVRHDASTVSWGTLGNSNASEAFGQRF